MTKLQTAAGQSRRGSWGDLNRRRSEQKDRAERPGVFYLNELLIWASSPARLIPRALTIAIMASAMNAAIRQYSMAVAPDSSASNLRKIRFNFASFQVALDVPDAIHALAEPKVA